LELKAWSAGPPTGAWRRVQYSGSSRFFTCVLFGIMGAFLLSSGDGKRTYGQKRSEITNIETEKYVGSYLFFPTCLNETSERH
jgi:hypothetical protein